MSDTIPARFVAQATVRPGEPAWFTRTEAGWQPTTWAGAVSEARQLARALVSAGFKPGDRLTIAGNNRAEWVLAAHAAMMAGGASAGVYGTCSADEVAYIVSHAEASIAFVEDRAQLDKLRSRREQLPLLKHIVGFRGLAVQDEPLFVQWEAFLARGDATAADVIDARIGLLADDGVGTLIYTSGTTGPPKAVMLTHRNLAWTAGVALEIASVGASDSMLSYLPLSHIAEQMFTVHVPATCGSHVYFARSIETLKEDLASAQPTIFFGVPRVWEKMNAGIAAKLKDATGAKRRLAAWAMATGRAAAAARNAGGRPGLLLALQERLAERLVLAKVRAAIGLGRARFCVSGAAPIAPDVLEFFSSFGLIIHEVYGQSEGCGPTSFNRPGATRFGSVGPAVPGVELRIAEDGEICARGPNVFKGYLKDETATNEALLDGWLRSGDLGQIDAQGFLHITGRKKDIIVTAGGKNIAPKNIEGGLKESPYVVEAVVIGDRRPFLSALLVVEGDVKDEVLQAHVDAVNSRFARVEHVRKWRRLPRPLDVEHGELTPTLKVKRKRVDEHFKAIIDEMYAQETP